MLNELQYDPYYQAKVRVIDVLREASKRLGVPVDAVVIDGGRLASEYSATHVIKLQSPGMRQQTVAINHDSFIDKDKFYQEAVPLIEQALIRLAS